jgi:hypothetical protein
MRPEAVVLIAYGVVHTYQSAPFFHGICTAGISSIDAAFSPSVVAGGNRAPHPSASPTQSELSHANGSVRDFSLFVTPLASRIITVVVASIAYSCRQIDRNKITKEGASASRHAY